jgi:hypothetical protein
MADSSTPPAGSIYSMEPDRLKQFGGDLTNFATGIKPPDDFVQHANGFGSTVLRNSENVQAALGLSALNLPRWVAGLKGTITYRGAYVNAAADSVPNADYEMSLQTSALTPEQRATRAKQVVKQAADQAAHASTPQPRA